MSSPMIRAGLWSSAESLFRFGLQFGVSVVLARILSPQDFGIYALTFVFLSLSAVLVDGGLSSALIQRQETDQQTETAVFVYNVLAGALLSLCIVVIAPFVAHEYGFPILRDLLFASAGLVFISSLTAVPGALMHRRLEFSTISKIVMVSSLLGGAAGITAAILDAGIWTFIIQSSVSTLYSTVATWLVTDWRPRRPWRLEPARSLMRYGSYLMISSVLESAYSYGYPLVLAKFSGILDVAYFNRGQNIQANPSSIVSSTVQRLLFPALSRCITEKEKVKVMVKDATRAAVAINTPVMIFLSVFSDLTIGVIYGGEWRPAGPVLTILAISGVVFPLQVINLQVLLASGKSDIFLRIEIYKKIIGTTLMVVGCFFGLVGLAIAQAIFLFAALILNIGPTAPLTGYSLLEQLRDCVPAVALSSAVMTCLWLAAPFFTISAPLRLVLILCLGSSVYLALALLLRVGPFRDVLAMIKAGKRGAPV